MPTACVIFTCQRNHDALRSCLPTMLPLIQMFDTFIATDLRDEQRAELLSVKGAKFSIKAGLDAGWVDVARREQLRADGYTNLLSVLDDFFSSVNTRPVDDLARLMTGSEDRQAGEGKALIRPCIIGKGAQAS